MDFGALPKVDGIDFSMPPDPDRNRKVLEDAGPGGLKPYLGLPILSDPGYQGRLYPKGVKTRDALRLYSQRFNTLEFNTTHYGIPKRETVDQWRQSVTDNFRFCPKVPQVISHTHNLGTTDADRDHFLEVICRLGPTLGPLFIQFPPHFGTDRLSEMVAFLERWPSEVALMVELREEGWFLPQATAWQELCDALEGLRQGLVITDVAGRRDVLHMTLTIPSVLVRFNGYGLHATDYERTKAWQDRLRGWQNLGLREFYFFQHQHHPPNSLDMVRYMAESWNQSSEPKLQVPRLQNPAAQQSLF